MKIPDNFRQITKEEFYNTIGKTDVHPTPVGKYPYDTQWKNKMGYIVGITIGQTDSYFVGGNK